MTHSTQLGHLARTVSLGVILLGLACTCGCGSSSKVESHASVGQQLQDLDAARNKGLLTEDEYHKQREEIMKRK